MTINRNMPLKLAGIAASLWLATAAAAEVVSPQAVSCKVIKNAAQLQAMKNVEIDKYFWNDATRTASWKGPVTTRATLGTFAAIGANATLNNSNVIGAMKTGQLVLLRGTYTKVNGAKANHWLLGTLYTAFGNAIGTVIANDPWTGEQVMIEPSTKKVVWPADFPLAGFKVDGYQPVTVN